MIKQLCFLILCVCIFTQLKAQQIKIVTYNIRYNNAADGENSWPLRKGKFDTLLNNLNADIWCFQEVLNSQLIDLKVMLPNYSFAGIGRDDGKEAGEFSPIFYNDSLFELIQLGTFWLSATPNDTGSKGWDAAITRICTWVKLKHKLSGKVFFVFNTHFDHIGVNARENSAKLILTKMNELTNNEPIILAGDFNSEPTDKAYKNIIKNKIIRFKDSFIKQKFHCTFIGFKVNGGICKRIDFIFINKYFNVKFFEIINQNDGKNYPSDHLPVLTILNMK